MNGLTQALKTAAQKYGAPAVGHVMRPTGKSFLSLVFGDDDTYFMLSSDKYTVYELHKHDSKVTPHSWQDLGTRTGMLDAMATIAVEFTKPCRALTVVKAACTAIAPLSHFERINVFNQYHDAVYSARLRERASTYAMGMPI